MYECWICGGPIDKPPEVFWDKCPHCEQYLHGGGKEKMLFVTEDIAKAKRKCHKCGRKNIKKGDTLLRFEAGWSPSKLVFKANVCQLCLRDMITMFPVKTYEDDVFERLPAYARKEYQKALSIIESLSRAYGKAA